MSFADRVSSQYKDLIAGATGGEKSFREEAWQKYAKLGMPDKKYESWRYTSNAVVTKAPWELSPTADSSALPQAALDLLSVWAKDFDLLVTVNGTIRLGPSTLNKKYLRDLDFASLALNFEDGWTGLASALARPGFHLEINEALPKPLLIVHAQVSGGTWSPTVNRISVGRGIAFELAEIHLGNDLPYLRSEMTSVDLAQDAVLNYVRVQQEHIQPVHFSEVQARLQSNAILNLTQLHGGSAWCRSSLRAEILGERAEAHLSGLTFARARQHIDQRVEVRHAKGLSTSTQLFKSVLKDFARGVLNGKILIERDAQKVSSMQLNHNLLLSPTAEADTKPELEIYADDVKANHGASIGRLSDDEMFYLMSRGIPRALAQQMLAHAFAGDVLMKIGPKTLRRFADSCLQSWLPEFSAGLEQSLDGGQR